MGEKSSCLGEEPNEVCLPVVGIEILAKRTRNQPRPALQPRGTNQPIELVTEATKLVDLKESDPIISLVNESHDDRTLELKLGHLPEEGEAALAQFLVLVALTLLIGVELPQLEPDPCTNGSRSWPSLTTCQ